MTARHEHVQTIGISGFSIGTCEDQEGITGVSVILAPREGACAGVDVRGCAPGTRETDLLKPDKTVQKIHAVVLAGGSAFGLDAAGGVMSYLSEKGVGFPVGDVTVPIVCGAVLFDLCIGNSHAYPNRHMGYLAAERASKRIKTGNAGAGMGATVGKLLGFDKSMKSGVGYHELHGAGGLSVGAYVAVNACGEIFSASGAEAGALNDTHDRIVSSHELMLNGYRRNLEGANTTIGCILTNAVLTKAECRVVCGMAHDGYALAIRPVHTSMDGDTVFAMASGKVQAALDTVGYMAETAMKQAILDAVHSAETLGGMISASDLRLQKRETQNNLDK